MEPVFPGMDPYLEAPGIWPGFHDALLFCIREALQPVLPERYYAELQTREEVGIGGLDTARILYPDLTVKEAWEGQTADASGKRTRGSLQAAVPEHLVIVEEEPIRVSYLEIREAVRGGRLVTMIEVLSPSNKIPGQDRNAFERKQKDVFASEAHWIEMDLLRAGKRMGGHPGVDAHCRRRGYDYLIVVSRGSHRSPRLDLELFGFAVRDALPGVPVPLLEPDPDVVLDLAWAFRRAYETGPYRKILRYDLPPDPPLEAGDADWARQLLEARGLLPR